MPDEATPSPAARAAHGTGRTRLRPRLARLLRPQSWSRPSKRQLAAWTVGCCAAAGMLVAPLVAIDRRMQARATGRIYTVPAQVPTRYVGIVLGAFTAGDRPSDVLEDRLQTALEIYRAGRVQRLLVSGDHGEPGYDEVGAMRLWLLRHGVPDDDIFMDHAGFRTLDTMERAAKVFQVDGAVVVTQAFHLARALFLAERAGIDAVGIVADKRRYIYADHYARREFLARVRSWFDVRVLGKTARLLGPPIPITGSAVATHDETTKP